MFPFFPFLNKMCGKKVFDLIFFQFLEATVLTNGGHLHLGGLSNTHEWSRVDFLV